MSNDLEIKNCFEYLCPEKWENLEDTENESVRFCGACEKQVFKATNKKTFKKLTKEEKCVAYFSGESVAPTYMGETVYPAFIDDKEFN